MTEAKPVFLASTDWHFTTENSQEILEIVRQKLSLARDMGLRRIYMLGDMFVSRVAQRMEILDSFWDVLNLALEYDIRIYVIPGNHDKTDYKSDRSFLRFYQHHPSLKLVENYFNIIEGDYEIHMMPFFADWSDKLTENFAKCCKPSYPEKKQILMSHFALTGSINNDGSKITKAFFKVGDFAGFHQVFLGHYHNTHNVSKNIMHMPSLRQNNFGEDDNKGFVAMYDDDYIEIINPIFTKYIKIKFDLDEIQFSELFKSAEKWQEQAKVDNIRFIVTGGESEIRSIDIAQFTELGIDVKKNIKGFIPQLVDAPVLEEVMEWSESDVMERFIGFCQEKELNHDQGLEYLLKIVARNEQGN